MTATAPAEFATAVRHMAPKRLIPFCLQMFPEYSVAPHHKMVAEALERVERGECRRLIVSMPPRHGKSQLTSIFFPAWFLGRNPAKRVILAAHTADLAEEFSRQARNCLMDSRWPFPAVALAKDSKSVANWNLADFRGGFTAAGIGGPITGKGGDVLIVDDPIKNADEAMSRTQLEKQWAWYTSTLYTRQAPGAAIILCMTRWSEGDLAGRVLDEMKDGGEQWEEIVLPAVALPGDPLGRETGEPLWPERYDAGHLRDTQRTIGPRDWNALYMQRPVPDQGLYFRRDTFQYFEPREDAYILPSPTGERAVPNHSLFRFLVADLAISQKSSADYTVIQCWGIAATGEMLLLDMWRDRYNGASMEDAFELAYNTWHPDSAYIESVGFQSYLIQNLKRRLRSLPIMELKPDRDKIMRALAVAERFSARSVYFRRGADWLADLEHELLTFPGGRHDDQVDATAYAGIVHSSKAFGHSAPYAKPKRWTGWAT